MDKGGHGLLPLAWPLTPLKHMDKNDSHPQSCATFVADLHIHSRFSMATSRQLNIPHLAGWAARKGIHVLGTGDFTHPKWRQELRQFLAYDEQSGLYRCQKTAGPQSSGTLFCLQTEISSIYRRGGRVRKVHNLIFAPNLDVADEIARRLALVGNINSDGRPILGLDSRDLLELVLDCSEDCVLVPAHIWTPWFSLFGSRSGFDTLEECYGDLSGHIFALETGLSSDPAMNRCWSALDGYALISNSDAHSGPNLGREANLFCGRPSYAGMFQALRIAAARIQPDPDVCQFLGTMEFYPEEGKYHLDGHRACNIVLDPLESRKLNNICPFCGKPLTIGVLHRVMELADRSQPTFPPREPEARMLVPLPEIVAQIIGSGVNSAKVRQKCDEAVNALGPELAILCRLPIAEITSWWEPLGRAVANVRNGRVNLRAGYDGEYGQIMVFSPEEAASLRCGGKKSQSLPGLAGQPSATPARKRKLAPMAPLTSAQSDTILSEEQNRALNVGPGPVLVMAGPGSGKTRVLVGRLQKLLDHGIAPQKLLAITFTRRAAGEMRQRLAAAIKAKTPLPECDTMHALAWNLFNESQPRQNDGACGDPPVLVGEDVARRLFYEANAGVAGNLADIWTELCLCREKRMRCQGSLATALCQYQECKTRYGILDYTDILEWLLAHAQEFAGRWLHVLVDEAQDLSPLQVSIIRALLPESGAGFFGIGDPDQSIYEFRGATGQIAQILGEIWPDLQIMRLNRSYRAGQKILDMAGSVLASGGQCGPLTAASRRESLQYIFPAADEKMEARWIADKIKLLLGSTSHSLLDEAKTAKIVSPGDIAILTRIKAQIPVIARTLEAAGIPCHAPAGELFWQDAQCGEFIAVAMREMPDENPQKFLESIATKRRDYKLLAKNSQFARLCSFWRQCGSWAVFFERLAWLAEDEIFAAKAEKVSLLTIHAAKGLEFAAIFLPGLENGILPLDRKLLYGAAGHCEDSPDAEQRLLYVGLTRATDMVFASFCASRQLYGKNLHLAPSPYLALIEKYCRASRAGHKSTQGSLF